MISTKTSRLCPRFAVVALVLCTGAANAASTVYCPGTLDPNDREFGLTPDQGSVSCFAYGEGNLNGNNDAINQLGFLTLDKSDVAGNILEGVLTGTPVGLASGVSGTFTIGSTAGYTDLLLALKGGNNDSPVWAVFALTGVSSGQWSVSTQSLSHALLYGKQDQNAPPVPLPPAAWLLGSGLLGLLSLGRRRRAG